jgi:hypothetical protein
MAYQYNIPAATDQISVSQGDIQGNFQALGAIAGNGNAGSPSLNSNAGFNFVYSRNIGAAPAYVAGTTKIWTQTYAPTTRGELFIGNDTTPLAGIPITASNFASPGYAYLPSGVLIKWGTVTVNGSTPVNLNGIGPDFTAVFIPGAVLQNNTGTSTVNVVSLIPATLTLTSPNNRPCYWFVIGY